jgi:hypothetical protein
VKVTFLVLFFFFSKFISVAHILLMPVVSGELGAVTPVFQAFIQWNASFWALTTSQEINPQMPKP